MPNLVVTMSPPDVGSRMRELARLFPQQMYQAVGRAGAAYRGRLRQVMRQGGGVHGVPAFAPLDKLSLALRPRKQIGGALAQSAAIQMYAGAGRLVVGWISALDGWARPLQEHEARPTTRQERHYFYQRLARQEKNALALEERIAGATGEAQLRSAAARKALRRGGMFAGLRARRERRLAGYLRTEAAAARRELRRNSGTMLMAQTIYYRRARPVIEPFAQAHTSEFPRWVEGAAGKLIFKRLAGVARVHGAAARMEPAA